MLIWLSRVALHLARRTLQTPARLLGCLRQRRLRLDLPHALCPTCQSLRHLPKPESLTMAPLNSLDREYLRRCRGLWMERSEMLFSRATDPPGETHSGKGI